MTIQKTFQLLDQIEKTSGTNDKLTILEQGFRDNLDFEKFIRLAEEHEKYGVSDKSFERAFGHDKKTMGNYFDVGELSVKYAKGRSDYYFDDIRFFTTEMKKLSGLRQMEFLKKILMFDNHFAKWVSRILVNDLKIGIQLKSINKVLEKMNKPPIERFQVQLCGSFPNVYEAYQEIPHGIVAIKMDGIRIDALKKGDDVILTSRSGKDIDYAPEIKEHIRKKFDEDIH